MSDSHRPVPVPNAATDTQRADQLLTVADVAGRIGAHEQTVRGWIKSGELKAARFGTRIGYRIRLGDYEEFLAGAPSPAPSPRTSSGKQRRPPTPEPHRRGAR